jgi:hypothetical protein
MASTLSAACFTEQFTDLGEKRMYKVKVKLSPLTGRGCLQGCKMMRFPHCLENQLTDCGEVVSLTYRPHSTPQKHFSGSHLC